MEKSKIKNIFAVFALRKYIMLGQFTFASSNVNKPIKPKTYALSDLMYGMWKTISC